MSKVEEHVVDHEAMINDLDNRLQRLRVIYEQYFLGIEKRPPLIPLKQVVRLIRELESEQLKNTALKFRFRSLVQRFYAYRAYWQRTQREIENGTYQKHRKKVERRAEEELINQARNLDVNAPEREAGAIQIDVGEIEELSSDDLAAMGMQPEYAETFKNPDRRIGPVRRPGDIRGMSADEIRKREAKLAEIKAQLGMNPDAQVPAMARSQPQHRPAPASGARYRAVGNNRNPRRQRPKPSSGGYTGGVMADEGVRSSLTRARISEGRLKQVYQDLVTAKRQCNQSTAKLSYDSVVRSIAKQANSVQSKHRSSAVDFKVVIKNGKAYLKPEPK